MPTSALVWVPRFCQEEHEINLSTSHSLLFGSMYDLFRVPFVWTTFRVSESSLKTKNCIGYLNDIFFRQVLYYEKDDSIMEFNFSRFLTCVICQFAFTRLPPNNQSIQKLLSHSPRVSILLSKKITKSAGKDLG